MRNKKQNKIENQVVNMTYKELVSFLSNNSNTARNLSGVYQCIELISNTISKLPFFVIDNNTKKHITDDNGIYRLLNLQPNSKMNASIFKKTLITNLLENGNAYIKPVRVGIRSFEIKELRIIKPEDVSIGENTLNGEILYTVTKSDGSQEDLRYDEIIHLKLNPDSKGIKGCSPITYAKLTTSVGIKQEEFQESFYDNGGRPDGVLKTTADLSDRKVEVTTSDGKKAQVSMKDAMRLAWKSAHSGSDNRFNVAILDNGLEYQAIQQISPADMDFVNSKTTNIEDICRYFNVPPYKLGVGKQTYGNNEQANIEYLTGTIVPLVTQMEQEFTIKLLTNEQIDKGWAMKCNIEAELRGDSTSRATWYKQMQSIGAYSINEIREKENMPNIDNGEARLVGANSTPLDLIVKGVKPEDITPTPLTDNKKEETTNE